MNHIFIAEDNYADAILLREALRESGIQAEYMVVEDGERALERLVRLGIGPDPLPDLIVLDLNLPRIRGHEILRAVRSDPHLRAIPTVVVTSSGAARDRDRCVQADGYYLKCSDWEECLKLARRLAAFLPEPAC